MFRKVRELISGQDRMKIQVHSSNNGTFYASGSCHMIIQKKMSSGEFHLVRNVPAEAARSQTGVPGTSDPALSNVRLCCPSHLAQPHKGENRPAMVTEQVRGLQGELWPSAIPHLTLSPRPHTHTCRHLHQGARQRCRKPAGWKATSCLAKTFKKYIFFSKVLKPTQIHLAFILEPRLCVS